MNVWTSALVLVVAIVGMGLAMLVGLLSSRLLPRIQLEESSSLEIKVVERIRLLRELVVAKAEFGESLCGEASASVLGLRVSRATSWIRAEGRAESRVDLEATREGPGGELVFAPPVSLVSFDRLDMGECTRNLGCRLPWTPDLPEARKDAEIKARDVAEASRRLLELTARDDARRAIAEMMKKIDPTRHFRFSDELPIAQRAWERVRQADVIAFLP